MGGKLLLVTNCLIFHNLGFFPLVFNQIVLPLCRTPGWGKIEIKVFQVWRDFVSKWSGVVKVRHSPLFTWCCCIECVQSVLSHNMNQTGDYHNLVISGHWYLRQDLTVQWNVDCAVTGFAFVFALPRLLGPSRTKSLCTMILAICSDWNLFVK